jgi:hypothetical protein
MKNIRLESRRRFLCQASLVGFGVLISACGGGQSQSSPIEQPKSPEASETCDETPETTYLNPGHHHIEIHLSVEELMSANPGVYILLSGSHNHSFTLGSEDLISIQNGNSVEKEDMEGHEHRIRIVCSA